ncbi:MAG: hypothetical protein MJ139_06155, partial [Limosilactobacillus sp.]|nr:hypothetical protein [Limosilactobacillus sp.]
DFYNQIKTQLDQKGIIYSGFTVTQLPDYNGRQAFKLHFDEVHPLGDTVDQDAVYSKLGHSIDQGFKISLIQNSTSDVETGVVGPQASDLTTATLYGLSNQSSTPYISAYVNVDPIANYYGVNLATVLDPTYTNFIYPYQIEQAKTNVNVKINLVSQDGITADQTGQTNKTNSYVGPVNSIVNILTPTTDNEPVLPRSQSVDGNTYYLKDLLQENNTPVTSPLIRLTSSNGSQITNGEVQGQTYTAVYSQSVVKVGQLNNATAATSQPVTNVTIGLANSQNVKLPTDWADNSGTLTSGDIAVFDQTGQNVTSQAQAGTLGVGTYTTKLTEQGLAKLAAVNPNLYIQRGAVADGQLTVYQYEALGNFNNQTAQTGVKLTQVTATMKAQNAQGSITVPSEWTTTAGTTQVDLTSGDVKLVDAQGTDVTSQATAGTLAAGDYQIELTEQGLNKLK